MAGSDRKAKHAILSQLVPTFLHLSGTVDDDWYSLTPGGALQCKHVGMIRALACDLRKFVIARFTAAHDAASFSWTEIKEAIRIHGTGNLTDDDCELVEFVLFCLGVWTRAGQVWTRPPSKTVEVLIDTDDVDRVFEAVNEQLIAMAAERNAFDRGEYQPTMPFRFGPTTMNVFNAPVGSVAAAPGSTAQGTVNINRVDAALHKAIEVQDELGDLADAVLALLRAARKLELQNRPEDALLVAITEAEEFKAFQKAVRPKRGQAAVAVARSVLELVPLLKQVLALLPDS